MKKDLKPDEVKPRDHNFDGIEEYDNDLPKWWVNLFWLTIIYGVGYLVWYHTPIGSGQSQEQEFKSAWADAKNSSAAAGVTFDYAAATKNAEICNKGKETYAQLCAPCHGPAGQGTVGPNLTDDFWLNGSTFADLEDVVTKGRPEKGMPSWGEILGKEKVNHVISYIGSIQHSNPENPKEAQGAAGVLK